jgi:hypothetical protein
VAPVTCGHVDLFLGTTEGNDSNQVFISDGTRHWLVAAFSRRLFYFYSSSDLFRTNYDPAITMQPVALKIKYAVMPADGARPKVYACPLAGARGPF